MRKRVLTVIAASATALAIAGPGLAQRQTTNAPQMMTVKVTITDDTITMKAPLSAFFESARPFPIKPDVFNWLVKAAQGSITFTSDIRIIIEAPDVILGAGPDGRPVTSLELCDRRLWTLRKAMLGLPEIRPHLVRLELGQQQEATPGSSRASADWEDRGQVILAFSNQRQQNR